MERYLRSLSAAEQDCDEYPENLSLKRGSQTPEDLLYVLAQ